ncbi:MAG: ABC transporter permease subunit [Eggerthellaceae bacterium]
MNIFTRELRANFKVFLIWAVVIIAFMTAGIMKFTGIGTGGTEMVQELMDAFPKPVLVILGFGSGVNIAEFSGFFAILEFYMGILIAIYAAHLGYTCVSRESADGTYEFLFTRPKSRASILTSKLAAALVYLILFCVIHALASYGSYASLDIPTDSHNALDIIIWFSVWLFTIALMFLSIGACAAALASRLELGSRIGMASVLVAYFFCVLSDGLDPSTLAGSIMRVLSPLRYWEPNDIIDGTINIAFTCLAAAVVVACLAITYRRFDTRDLAEHS